MSGDAFEYPTDLHYPTGVAFYVTYRDENGESNARVEADVRAAADAQDVLATTTVSGYSKGGDATALFVALEVGESRMFST